MVAKNSIEDIEHTVREIKHFLSPKDCFQFCFPEFKNMH